MANENKPQAGNPYPLGSHYDGKGVNFALFSAHATKVELCLFDKSGAEEQKRYEILSNEQLLVPIFNIISGLFKLLPKIDMNQSLFLSQILAHDSISRLSFFP